MIFKTLKIYVSISSCIRYFLSIHDFFFFYASDVDLLACWLQVLFACSVFDACSVSASIRSRILNIAYEYWLEIFNVKYPLDFYKIYGTVFEYSLW